MNITTTNGDFAPSAARDAGISRTVSSADGEIKQRYLKLKKASKDFQALFISYLLKTMRQTVPESELFGKGLGGEVFTEMFDTKIAEHLSGSAGMALDDILFNQLAPNALGDDWKSISDEFNLKAATNAERIKRISAEAPPFDNIVREVSRKYNISASLIHAVISAESAGNPHAVSHKGAKGLMQLTDSTCNQLGVSNPFDPEQNINGGVRYLRELLDRYEGRLELALAAYNAGPANVDKYGGIPPFRETNEYVKRILTKIGI
ncbi:MAG: transglycosylase SLT domain-containing protein [candidate division Zixibacteria bacterium]|nr:transglycosylase SLT domain-containing protein [candidate division Zixibacteria bacterium]